MLPLASAVAKMSGQTAAVLGLSDRGRIEVGAAADLVLFDAARVRDAARYDAPVTPAEGILRVYVNGRLAFMPGTEVTEASGKVLCA
ncbi:Amidohydrolase family protein [Aliiruegeria lutimaris]|uniref:Amidohydrolase family protein n=1 Tax=Aliiruegeria lutimaris TaxID=571298 RepID=A0A1G8S5R0_9RHOB|nr:Amidohydrolase family protein [Aliiruegeria lutimaris]